MKNILLLICLSFIISHTSNAQIRKIATHTLVANYQLDLSKDALALENSNKTPSKDNHILSFDASFANNELSIKYQLAPIKKIGHHMLYLDIRLDNELVQPHPGYVLGDIGRVENNSSDVLEIVWTNFIADLPKTKGLLQITLRAEKQGILYLAYGVDCDHYPRFDFQQKLPYYTGMAVGVGSLVTAVIFKEKAQKKLEEHQSAIILLEQREKYDAYTKDLKIAKITTYVGISIVAADVLLYLLRKNRHQKKLRVFEENCTKNSLSINPYFELQGPQNKSELGFHLSYHF